MTYDPKIYIRGYGNPSKRILVFSGSHTYNGVDLGLLRHLVLNADNPSTGEEFFLLEGDAQSGSDVLLLEGDAQSGSDMLALNAAENMRFFSHSVEFIRTLSMPLVAGDFSILSTGVGLIRSIMAVVDNGSYLVSGSSAGLLRHLVLQASPGIVEAKGDGTTINTVASILLEGDAQSGSDVLLLEGDAQSGGDEVLFEFSV